MFPSRRIITSGGDVFRDEWSLAFDGTNDHIATSADSSIADGTYVFWFKSSTTGENKGILGHGAQAKGAFHMHHASSKPLLYMDNAFHRFWNDTSAQDDGQWHHWAVTFDVSDITACNLYIDGVIQTVQATTSSGTAPTGSWDAGLTIGANKASGGNFCEGSVSDFAWYSGLLSINEIQILYNGRESYNHMEGPVARKLSGWWRMGDGIEGGSGTTIYDTSSNSNNGTMTNMDAVDFEGDTP